MPDFRRARRPLAALLVAGGAVAAAVAWRRNSSTASLRRSQQSAVCHPNLSHLRDDAGREVLLIGTLQLDLEDTSGALVSDCVRTLVPDVVMVGGTWTAGVNAMILKGRWELHGMPRPGSGNWSDTGDAKPVELPKITKSGKRSFFGGPSQQQTWPTTSMVPVKVGHWANHLRSSVGGDVAAAVASAAAASVPVHFLGPAEGGYQGHMQVSLLAQQAATELLEEEHHRGENLPNADLDAALHRAESRVREDGIKWLRDARSETSRVSEVLLERAPPPVREKILQRIKELTGDTANHIVDTMKEYHKGAAVVPVDLLVGVETQLIKAGFSFVSHCA
mmetsp:Transcript_46179/g.100332  ORF Transcript_46179/g.100332 Transcript_46179/m.100332 type:complete len:335 (+) Transcript_46179:45-1049(+)